MIMLLIGVLPQPYLEYSQIIVVVGGHLSTIIIIIRGLSDIIAGSVCTEYTPGYYLTIAVYNAMIICSTLMISSST